MLRLPRAGEVVPALVEQAEADTEVEAGEQPAESHISDAPEQNHWGQEESPVMEDVSTPAEPAIVSAPGTGEWRRRKKHRSRGKNAENDWQHDERKILRFSGGVPLLWWWLAAGLLSLGIIVTLVILLRPKSDDQAPALAPVSVPYLTPPPSEQDKDSATAQQLAQIREGHAAIEAFFRVTSVEDLLPLLRPMEGLEEKVRQYYAKQPLPDALYDGMEKPSSTLLANGTCLQIQIRRKDQTTRLMTLFKPADRFLVDWESWVVWSEMDYHTLTQKKPLKPTEVRVTVETESYYNYDFPSSSENEWQSYRLIFDGDDRVLHGYVQRGSAVHQAVALASDVLSRPMLLRIRYRDEDSHHTQVLIESVAADSWVKGLPSE